MNVLATILPVVFMLGLGKYLAVKKLLSREAMDGIKALISQLMLPVVIFHALITTTFTRKSILLSLLVYAMFTVVLLLGIFRKKRFGRYGMGSFLLAGCEGGMLGYPLYITLYGAAKLSVLMALDLGNILFAFTFFIVLINVANHPDADRKKVALQAVTSPLVLIVAVGILLNVTGLSRFLTDSAITPVYTGIESVITAPLTALVLLSVGYDLNFRREIMGAVLKVSAVRFALMATGALLLLTAGRSLIDSQPLYVGVLLYFALPPQFITPIFVREDENRAYVSTMLSFYSLITVAAYILITILVPLQ